MTINIQNCANVNVLGHHNGRNCKAVYNITKGVFYASVLDAARILEVSPGAVSFALSPNHTRTCKGMRLCFVSRIMENLDEIKVANDIRAKKSAEDEAASTEYAKLRKAQEDYKKHKQNAEEFRRLEAEELRLMEEADRILRGK
jgi:predicted transcriptional regulator